MIQKLIQTITQHIPEDHIALGHDWLLGIRGGEKVFQAIAQCFPNATIYTLFYDKKTIQNLGLNHKIKASFLNRLPYVKHYYRYLFLLFPWAIRSLSPQHKHLILTSSHSLIKNISPKTPTLSVAYIHAPLRYLYTRKEDYLKYSSLYRLVEPFFRRWLSWIKKWDKIHHKNIKISFSNSRFIADQVKSIYNQNAQVIHPFYNQQVFKLPSTPVPFKDRSYYLWVGALVPYKLPEIVIKAFVQNKKPLLIVGEGPLSRKLQRKYTQNNIIFLGSVQEESLVKIYQHAKALVFPGIEDFGIVPLEAAACGCPIIAYPKGGIVESLGNYLIPLKSQTTQSICKTVNSSKYTEIDLQGMSQSLEIFSKDNFLNSYLKAVKAILLSEQKQQQSLTT
jgi:glycosyltransferase involved in cell wall biosynthesis